MASNGSSTSRDPAALSPVSLSYLPDMKSGGSLLEVQNLGNRHSKSEENISSTSSPTSRPVSSRWSTMTEDSTDNDDDGKEEDAEAACYWLEMSGFPQYAQLFRENFLCDPSQLRNDHEFLNEYQIQAVARRLLILNASLSRRKSVKNSVKSPPKETAIIDGDENEEAEDSVGDLMSNDQPGSPASSSPEGIEADAEGSARKSRLSTPQPALSSNWTYRKESKKWSRSFREARRLSDSSDNVETIQFAKAAAHKWSNFVRQKSMKQITDKNVFTNISSLTCREILVVQRLSLLSLTDILDRYQTDTHANKKWEKKVMSGLTKLIAPKKNVEYDAVGVFGVALQTMLERTGQPLPAVILDAIQYLRESALNVEGILRKSGSAQRVKDLREKCEKATEKVDFSQTPPHDVADLIKQYFRDLPDPLLTTQLSDIFIEVQKLPHQHIRSQVLRLVIPLLPDENREVLHILLQLLYEISRRAEVGDDGAKGNQMNANNLALVFAPNIFHLPNNAHKKSLTFSGKDINTMKELQTSEAASNCLKSMIEEYDGLFTVSSDLNMQVSFITSDHRQAPSLQYPFDAENRLYFLKLLQKQTDDLLKEANDKFKSFLFFVRKDGIRISYKREDEEMLQTWCGQATVNALPDRVLERLTFQRYLWDPEIAMERLVEEISKETDVFHYTHRGCGPILPREYCLLRQWKNYGGNKCTFVSFSVTHPAVAESAGAVRAIVFERKFYIEKNDATSSRITYISRVDLRGRTPNWYNKAAGVHDVMALADIRKKLDLQQLPGPETSV